MTLEKCQRINSDIQQPEQQPTLPKMSHLSPEQQSTSQHSITAQTSGGSVSTNVKMNIALTIFQDHNVVLHSREDG